MQLGASGINLVCLIAIFWQVIQIISAGLIQLLLVKIMLFQMKVLLQQEGITPYSVAFGRENIVTAHHGIAMGLIMSSAAIG